METSFFFGDHSVKSWLQQSVDGVLLQFFLGLLLLVAVFIAFNWASSYVMGVVTRRFLLTIGKKDWLDIIQASRVRRYFARALSLYLLSAMIDWLPLGPSFGEFLSRLIFAIATFYLLLCLSSLLTVGHEIYARTPRAQVKSIKGYIEVIRIGFWFIGAIILLSVMIKKSPLLMISGLGALSAVLLLVFKDTLLSLVASAQMSTNDMLRIGDWIQMPQAEADGFVIDIALHTVKVQNWDKTVTTIPTYKLFSESYKNMRQMFESGGRRIKRSLTIDATTARFLTGDEIEQFKRFEILRDYLEQKEKEIQEDNAKLIEQGEDPVNQRRLTNLGTFRMYATLYLEQNQGVHQDMTMMVRMMEPTAEGIPVEIYCFTNDTAWVNYERIQGDIFDHLIAILPEMSLRLYQSPSGRDLTQGIEHLRTISDD
ncbi:MAG TPA: mechanosensitive ion channel domain-containing protein [Paenalcaligenes sp.]|nr:mechanosensitive ion channel domain-containing protein [Paenalcaligenes sp.]